MQNGPVLSLGRNDYIAEFKPGKVGAKMIAGNTVSQRHFIPD